MLNDREFNIAMSIAVIAAALAFVLVFVKVTMPVTEECIECSPEYCICNEFPDEAERTKALERLKAERELKEAKREKARQDFIEEFKASLPLNLHKNKKSDKDLVAYYNPATKTVTYRVQ